MCLYYLQSIGVKMLQEALPYSTSCQFLMTSPMSLLTLFQIGNPSVLRLTQNIRVAPSKFAIVTTFLWSYWPLWSSLRGNASVSISWPLTPTLAGLMPDSAPTFSHRGLAAKALPSSRNRISPSPRSEFTLVTNTLLISSSLFLHVQPDHRSFSFKIGLGPYLIRRGLVSHPLDELVCKYFYVDSPPQVG